MTKLNKKHGVIYMSKRDTTKLAADIIKNADKYGIPLKKKPKKKK